jgi:squalene-hopene/tetraprenyl-beta-curcumene cyclase
MNKTISFLVFLLLFAFCGASFAADRNVISPKRDVSLKFEISNAIEKGLKWLEKKQNPDGSWSQPEHPALSSLVLTAFMGEPSGKYLAEKPQAIRNGYRYLMSNVQPDGGIYSRKTATPMENYNTSIAMVALMVARDPSYDAALKNARAYVMSLQNEGGIGYNKTGHTDMSNTYIGLEALYYSKYLDQDKADKDLKKLDWNAAINFIQRCQNLPQYNPQEWVTDDAANRGGFVYAQNESKAGEVTLPSGRKALRSYGSMSYAGLLSYIYADMKKDDPRVQAVYKWLGENYTLAENPGMGQEGLYYYFHTMAKGLSAYGADEITLTDGKTVNWRKDLALRLMSLQNGEEGSWVNPTGRWWEKDPVLTTSYAVITLEIIFRGM